VSLGFAAFFLGAGAVFFGGRLRRLLDRPAVVDPTGALNDASRADMAASQLRDLAHHVVSDVEVHSAAVDRFTTRIITASECSDSDEMQDAAAELLNADKALQQRLEEAERRIEAQAREIRLQQMEARTDPLTDLANRRAFDQCLKENIELLRTDGTPFSVALFDVDDFKIFNDAYGHLAGDAVLKSLGQLLPSIIKDGDFAARYGGEEFAVIMPGTAIDEAKVAAEVLRKSIAAMTVTFEGQELSISASVGVAETERDEDEWKVVRRADDCIYASKHAGRNCAFWHNGTTCEPVFQSNPIPHPPMSKTATSSFAGCYAALPDVTSFLSSLQRRIAEMARSGDCLAVVYLQIGLADGFRQIPMEVLDHAAHVVRCALRDMDLIARRRSGEFIMMLPRCTAAAARIVVNRMAAELSSTKVNADGVDQRLSCHTEVQAASVGEVARELLNRLTSKSAEIRLV
jgi:diguanylate cyclase